jgi:hypothetical protein
MLGTLITGAIDLDVRPGSHPSRVLADAGQMLATMSREILEQ